MLHRRLARRFHRPDVGGEHGAGHHVLDHRHARERLHRLKVLAIPRAEIWNGFSLSIRSPLCRISPFEAGCTPVMILTSVLLPAPLGPIRPYDLTWLQLQRHIAYGMNAAEGPADILEFEESCHAVAALRT